MGLLERHGPDGHSTVRVSVTKNTKKQLLQAAIRAQVENNTAIFTDALKSYDGLSTDYVHEVIDHALHSPGVCERIVSNRFVLQVHQLLDVRQAERGDLLP